MATDPLKKDLNRAQQIKTDAKYQKGIKLYDIDYAINDHMSETVVPTVEEFDQKIKVPVIYGTPERWKAIRKDGYIRGKKGMIQVPLVMFKRNSISPNDSIPNTMNRNLTYPAQTKYSSKHRYDKFSLMTATQRPVEQYNITIPDYITVTYEVIIWTNLLSHMNKIIEAFQYATDEYWGDKYGFKFRTKIDSIDTTTEVGEGTERIVKSNFTLLVNAYLLPDKFDNKPTTQKSFSPKKVVWSLNEDIVDETTVLPQNATTSSLLPITNFSIQ